MTLTLELTPEQERRIREEAGREGMAAELFVLHRALGERLEHTPMPKTPEQIAKIKALRGSLAHVPGISVDDFIAEKRKEMAREDRF